MQFAKRTDWPAGLNALTLKRLQMEKRGETVLDLTESNPTRCGFSYLNEALLKELSHPDNLRYEPDPRGLLRAREAIAGYYAEKGVTVRPDRIFITASTSEAYAHLFRLLCDAGDTALAPEPSYPLFHYLAALADVSLGAYRFLEPGTRWRVDTETFGRLFEKKPKLAIVVNPNNPTGNYFSEDERKILVESCRRHGAAIVADEVFLDFPFDGVKKTSFASVRETLTFTLSGASKILGLPQMKCAWIVVGGPEAEAAEAARRLELIADVFLSAAAPAQNALPAWLSVRAPIEREISDRVRRNRLTLEKALSANTALTLLPAEGGWYAVVRARGGDDESLCLRLLERRKVATHPGYFFDMEGGPYLVISLLPEPELFARAAQGVAGAV